MPSQWYLARNRAKHGPYSFDQLSQFAKSGLVVAKDMLLQEGAQKWVTASSIVGLFVSETTAPTTPPPPSPPTMQLSEKHEQSSAPSATKWRKWRLSRVHLAGCVFGILAISALVFMSCFRQSKANIARSNLTVILDAWKSNASLKPFENGDSKIEVIAPIDFSSIRLQDFTIKSMRLEGDGYFLFSVDMALPAGSDTWEFKVSVYDGGNCLITEHARDINVADNQKKAERLLKEYLGSIFDSVTWDRFQKEHPEYRIGVTNTNLFRVLVEQENLVRFEILDAERHHSSGETQFRFTVVLTTELQGATRTRRIVFRVYKDYTLSQGCWTVG